MLKLFHVKTIKSHQQLSSAWFNLGFSLPAKYNDIDNVCDNSKKRYAESYKNTDEMKHILRFVAYYFATQVSLAKVKVDSSVVIEASHCRV